MDIWRVVALSHCGVVPPAGKALIFDPEDQNNFLLEDTMKNTGSGCLAVLVIVLVFVALIALFGNASGMPTVLDVQPTQIPTVPADGIQMFLHVLGF